MMSARELALSVICDVHGSKDFINVLLSRALKKSKLSRLDRAFATELVYGALRMEGTIDWVLSGFSSKKIDKIPPKVLDILRLGTYQLLYLDKIPSRAAIDESVKLTKKNFHQGIANFVNGILREIDRNRNKIIYPKKEDDLIAYVSLKHSHPKWLIRKWVDEIESRLPELPDSLHERFIAQFGLPKYDADLLVDSRPMAHYFEQCVNLFSGSLKGDAFKQKVKTISNWLLSDFSRMLNATNIVVENVKIKPEHLVEFIDLLDKGTVSGPAAKTVFEEMFNRGKRAQDIVAEKGLSQISDIDEIEKVNRNIYTGAIGYIGFDGNVDLNIVIRSILLKDNKAYFGVGGGITYESEEVMEYDETLDKAKALMKALS